MVVDGDGNQNDGAAAERAAERRRLYAEALADVVRVLGLRVRLGPRYDLTKDRRVVVALSRACREEGLVPPEEAFEVLVRAAVYEPDPSYNKYFVRPAVTTFGLERVRTALFDYWRTGTDRERMGAVRAWYWTGGEDPFLQREWDELALREFVRNEDPVVRHVLIPGLVLSKSAHPPELHALVAEALAIAQSHPDRYIRHRVEGMTGE